jgi:hypothetical protein
MSDLKNKLQGFFNELKGLEERARKLKNQNLADIATSARGKVQQLSEHPDLALVDEKKDQTAPGGDPNAPKTGAEAVARVRADGNDTDPEDVARMRWPQLFGQGPFKQDPQAPFLQPSNPNQPSQPFDPNAPRPAGADPLS